LLESAKDRNWLARVSATIHQHWHRKNSAKKGRFALLARPPVETPSPELN
jgi:hypothetical protein